MQGRILILAGGGGHTGIAYALAQALHKRASLTFLAPEGDSLSGERLNKFGEVKFLVKPRGPKTPPHIFALRLVRSFLDSMKLKIHEFDVIVSTGSNFCLSPSIVAWMMGVSLVNIESLVRFTIPSRVARILKPFSTITALHWEEQTRLLDGVVVGPILSKPLIKPWNGGYILVSGGTHGHKLLFDALSETSIKNIVLQTGEVNPTPYMRKHPEWKVITFTKEFHELLAGAELVISHFGSTVLDAVVYGKPVVLILNPELTRTVGIEDAEHLANKVNAALVSEISVKTILQCIDKARKRKIPALPNGAKNLANIIVKICQGSRKAEPANHLCASNASIPIQ